MSGRSTYSGTNFQAAVGAYLAGLMLAEEPLQRMAEGLPGRPRLVQLETLSGVDDVLVHTDLGRVFFQVKTTLPLSATGALASVADQFVQQYQHVLLEPGARPLNAQWDRLVLAVSPYASASITENLREGLERNRTCAVTAMPANYQKALALFSDLVDAAWLRQLGKPITTAERQAVLKLCMVVPITPVHRQVVEQTLTAVVATKGTETAAMECLITWAADVAAHGTGGDAAAVRLALTGKVAFLEPPSYQQDMARLRTHTADTLRRLSRFTALATTAGPIHLDRPAADALARVAPSGSVALTGEPGAGKSAILWTVAQTLATEHPVVCLTVSGAATSLEALRQDLRLEHDLLDVLREMAATRPAFLLLDALDAARGGAVELTYQQLLEAVELLPNWRVIASVRTFDLRMGKAWQALFPGAPPDSTYAYPGFGRVRHIHLGLLTDAERASLEYRAPELHEALVASGPKVEKLARNPFNLSLLADLLRLGAAAADLARVATRGQLLRRYWDTRIETLGTASFLGLTSLVKQMLKTRVLAVPLGTLKLSTGEAIDQLLRAGVLQREYPDRIEFRHHVLFDYAVARLALLNNSKADKYLHKRHTAGLLLAPSLGYWLEELRLDSAPTYWKVVMDLVGNDEVDPVVRVEVTRLTIEALEPVDRLTELARFFATPMPAALRGFRLFVSALAARVEAKEKFAVEPWAHLLDVLGTPPDSHLGLMQSLLESLLSVCRDSVATAALGRAARTLYARICQHEGLSEWLCKSVVGNVARTYATDPAASHQALAGIFAPDRLALVGFLEVPALAHHLLDFAESGPKLVVQLYHSAFQHHTFRHEGHVALRRSYITSMSMDPRDAFRLAEHELAERYPTLLARFPITGIRALAAALEGARLRHQVVTRALRPPVVGVAGKMYALEEDGSRSWAEDIESPHGHHYAELYQSYRAQLPALPLVLLSARFPALLLEESRAALVWRVLFETGTAHPAALGEVLWAAAASIHALVMPSAHCSAMAFLAAAYPVMSRARLEDAERTWLALAFNFYPDAERVRLLTLGNLFHTIGEAQLVTGEARAFLRRAVATERSLANDALASVDSSCPGETSWSPRAVPPTTEAPTELDHCVRAVAGAREDAERDPSAENINRLQQALTVVDAASHPADFDGGALATVAPALALVRACLPRDHAWHGRAAEWLVALAKETNATDEATPVEETRSSFVLDSPQGPMAVAKALVAVAALAGGWPSVEACVQELLLNAAHPAVRSELAEVLLALTMDHEEIAWALTGQLVTREAHPAVLRQVFRAVDCLAYLNAGRAEELLLRLSAKTATSSPPSDVVTGRVVQLGLGDGRTASLGLLYAWIPQFAREKDHLNAVLYCLRDLFADSYGAVPHQSSEVAGRTRTFILTLLDALEPIVRPLATLKRKATPDEVTANELFTSVAGQLFFGVGYSEFTANLVTRDAQQRFLQDYAPIMVRLARLGDPQAVNYLAMTISRFIAMAPQFSFDLFSEAMLHNTGIANYEEEPQGASHFIEMVTMFLSGHQYLFAEEDRRNKLIACIALFLDVGWPEAWPLFIHLRDMQQ